MRTAEEVYKEYHIKPRLCINSNGINLKDKTIDERLCYPTVYLPGSKENFLEKVVTESIVRPMTEQEIKKYEKEAYEETNEFKLKLLNSRAESLDGKVIGLGPMYSVDIKLIGEDTIRIESANLDALLYTLGHLNEEFH